MRLEQASVSLNDLLGGAAPDNRACITPVPLGRREAPAQRLEFTGPEPRNARVGVPWNDSVERNPPSADRAGVVVTSQDCER